MVSKTTTMGNLAPMIGASSSGPCCRISKGPFALDALDGQHKILFADLHSITMLAWVLHHGSTSSISFEKHAMAATPQVEYVSNQMSLLCDFWLASEIGRGQTIEVVGVWISGGHDS